MRASSRVLPLLPLGLLLLYGPVSFDPASVQPFGLFKQLVAYAAAISMVGCWAFLSWRNDPRIHAPSRLLGLCVSGVVAILLLSVIQAYNKQEAVDETNRIILMLALFYAAAHMRWNPGDLKLLLGLAVLPALWVAFTVIMEYTGRMDLFGIRVVFYRKEHRVLAFFGHNNIIAQYLLVISCWVCMLAYSAKRRAGVIFWILPLAFLLSGLYFTFCRSSWVSFAGSVLSTLFLIARHGQSRPGRFWKGALVTLALTVAFVLWVKTISPSPDSQGFSASQWKEAGVWHHISSGRFHMWGSTLAMIADNWLTGVGVGNYWIFYGRYDPERWEFVRYAHNDYLQFLAEFGLLGGGLFLLLLLGMVVWARPLLGKGTLSEKGTYTCATLLACGILAAMMDAFFSYDFYQSIPAAVLAGSAGVLVGLLRKPVPARPPLPFPRFLLAATLLFGGISEGWVWARQWHADHANATSAAYAAAGQWDRAIRHGEEANRLHPNVATYENALAVLYHRAGHVRTALRHYERARQLSPYEVPNHLGIISILKQCGDTDELLQYYPAFLAIAPHRADVRNEYAALLMEKGRFESAAAEYRTILSRDLNNPLVLLKLAGVLVKLSEYKDAFQIYQQLVQLPPAAIGDGHETWDSAIDIMNGLALSLDGMGNTAQAYEMLNRYRTQHPMEVYSYLTEIDIALKHNDVQRIRDAAQMARRIDPQVPLSGAVESLLRRP